MFNGDDPITKPPEAAADALSSAAPIPTVEEVVARGYGHKAAVRIVAEEQARAAGLSLDEIAKAGEAAIAALEAPEAEKRKAKVKAKAKASDAPEAPPAPAEEPDEDQPLAPDDAQGARAIAMSARDRAMSAARSGPAKAPPAQPAAPSVKPENHREISFRDGQGRPCRAWVVLPGRPADGDLEAYTRTQGRVLLRLLKRIAGEAVQPGEMFGELPVVAKRLVDAGAAVTVHPGAIVMLGEDPPAEGDG
jgi:hypothetical protein